MGGVHALDGAHPGVDFEAIKKRAEALGIATGEKREAFERSATIS
jgi:hypothetical protein